MPPTNNGYAGTPADNRPYTVVPGTVVIDADSSVEDTEADHRVRKHAEEAKSRGHKRLRKHNFKTKTRKRAKKISLTVLILGLIAAVAVNWYIPHTDAKTEQYQSEMIDYLQQQWKTLTAKQFPLGAAASAATPVAVTSLNYTDQQPAEAIAKLTTTSGWNGHGVGNISPAAGLYWDQDPSLNFVSGDYAAIPFRVRYANSTVPMEPLLLYVLTQRNADGSLNPLGGGTFFTAPPTFIAPSASTEVTSSTSNSDNPLIQTVKQFLAGESRYVKTGVNLSVNSGSLKATDSRNYLVYKGTPEHTIVTFDVLFTGPTTGATFWQPVSADLARNSDGEWRVQALGLDPSRLA